MSTESDLKSFDVQIQEDFLGYSSSSSSDTYSDPEVEYELLSGIHPIRRTQLSFTKFIIVISILLLLFGGCLFLRPKKPESPMLELPPAKYDNQYVAKRKLEIVIAIYKEDLHQLTSSISQITHIPSISELSPHITIYTKDDNANTFEIAQSVFGVSSVIKLPNRGREGGTFLSHIIENWDKLAEHTLFMQAEIHNLGHFLRRLEDFFIPETGMLSLGFSGHTCQLTDCTDPWNWHDDWKHFPQLYSVLYEDIAPPAQMLLSYKGQFVASAKRIRGVPKHVYEHLFDVLENDTSPWAYQDPVKAAAAIQGEVEDESPGNAPSFGYTLERMWGLLMQCADARIAVSCPSISTRRFDEPADSCQCLDDIPPAKR